MASKATGRESAYDNHGPAPPPSETTTLLGGTSSSRDSDGTDPVDDGDDGPKTTDAEPIWEGYKDFEGLPWYHRPSVFWLLGPFVIFTLAFGGVLVPKINLTITLVCRQYFADRAILDPTQPVVPVFVGGDNPQCKIPEVQSRVSTFNLAMSLVSGLLSAVVAPLLGRLSDRYGRTRLMAFSSVGGVIGEIITVFVATFPDKIDYRWLILSSVFDGATGSFTAGSILTQSYTSDCTPPSKRAVYIGYTHACLFTGLALGPMLAGYFVKWTGSLISVFYVIVACHASYILFLGFVVPESLSKRRRIAAQERWAREKHERFQSVGRLLSRFQKVNPFEPLSILWPTEAGTTTRLRINLATLAAIDAVIMGCAIAVGAVIVLYSEYMFDWGNFESSQFISAFSFIRVAVLMGLFPVINYFARTRPARRRRAMGIVEVEKNAGADRVDIWILRIAILSEIAGYVGYALAPNGRVFFASGMITALGGFGSATIQSSVTKHVPHQRVGQVLGAMGMLHALGRILGPILFNVIYATTVGTFPQAFLVVLSSLFGVTLFMSFILKPGVYWEMPEDGENEPLNPDGETRGGLYRDGFPIEEDDAFLT